MSRETDRLIADRGHGLSGPQRTLFAAVVRGEMPLGDTTRNRRTFGALARLGLLARNGYTVAGPSLADGRGLWGASYPGGHTLALRMGLVDPAQAADRRLAEESTGTTDDCRES